MKTIIPPLLSLKTYHSWSWRTTYVWKCSRLYFFGKLNCFISRSVLHNMLQLTRGTGTADWWVCHNNPSTRLTADASKSDEFFSSGKRCRDWMSDDLHAKRCNGTRACLTNCIAYPHVLSQSSHRLRALEKHSVHYPIVELKWSQYILKGVSKALVLRIKMAWTPPIPWL